MTSKFIKVAAGVGLLTASLTAMAAGGCCEELAACCLEWLSCCL